MRSDIFKVAGSGARIGIISGTRWALVFAAAVIALGAVCSLLIPNKRFSEEDVLEGIEEEPLGLAATIDPALGSGEL